MNKLNRNIVLKRNILIFMLIALFLSCSTTKKRGDLTTFGKLYHNTTSQYNGYFNATELVKESLLILEESNEDNYDDLLNVYAYQSDNPDVVYSQLDKAIEKVSTVVTLHRQSKWVDDCYLLLGKAQYFKQDYESAEETFRFFQEEFNAYNAYPDKSLGKTKPNTQEERKREREIKRIEKDEEKAVQKEEREEEKKIQQEKKEEERKLRDEQRDAKADRKKEENKIKDDIRELKSDLKKAEKKRKDDERKEKEKARKKKKRIPKKDPNKDYRSDKEKELAGKIEAKEQELANLRAEADKPKEDEESPEEKEEEVVEEEKNKEEAPKEDEESPEEEEDEVEKDFSRPTPPSGIFKHETAYHEGLLWLARTFAERDNEFSSEYILKNLEAEPGLYGHVEKEIPVSYAHLYIKQKNYPKAINALTEAIELADNKYTRARYAFIQGQLFEKLNKPAKALMAYERANGYKPGFEMRFHSSLKQVTLGQKSGQMSSEKALSKLNKMLKEDKFIEYESEVYMAIGQIYLSEGNQKEAIANFQLATNSSYATANKKAELYLELASLFYDQEKYLESSLYYDSTLQVIDKKHTQFDEVKRRAINLKGIAVSLQQIELQDSLMALSLLGPDEQREKAIEIIKQRRIDAAAGPALNASPGMQARNQVVRQVGKKSNFFAYNPIGLSQGQREFKRKFGNRSLEDNWRRSERPDATINFEEEVLDEDAEEVIEESEIKEVIAEIPNAESRKKIVLNNKAMAMFNLGVAYRNDIEDYTKSTETFDDLLGEFPGFDQKSDVYYYMYLNYLDLNQNSLAEGYANRLRAEFPDSDYTKMLFDESFIKAFKEEQNKVEISYEETYKLFEVGDFTGTKTRIDSLTKDLDKKHPYAPKFGLLEAMTVGNLQGKEAYIVALKAMTKRYPNTPEQVRASEILRFLDGKGDAFTNSLLDKEALESFKLEPKKLHYGVVIVYNLNDKQTQEAKISISNYNKENFKLDRLKVTSVVLNKDEKTQILLVRKFKNQDEATKYYKAASNAEERFLPESVKHELFMITQRNYRELLKQKSPIGYMSFFEDNYK